MNENDNKITFNASDVLFLIKKKWKHLLIVCSVALVASLIISFCIPEKYKSSVVLYPANSTSVSKTLATDENTEKGLLQFGEKEEVEQMMQMLQSNDIRNRIIEKYNLIEHYRIDPNTKYLYTKLYDKYEDNVKISRTEYTSVKVEVLDESPDTAAMIANDISQLLDTVYSRMQRERAYKALKIVENAMLEQEALVKNISDSLEKLGQLGVIEVKSQTEMYSEQYAIALANGNTNKTNELKAKLDSLAKYGGAHTMLTAQLKEEVQILTQCRNKFREAKIELEQDLPNAFIVNKAEKAERSTYPIRWLIVLSCVFSTFLLALMVLAIVEPLKKKDGIVISETKEKITYKEIFFIKLPNYETMESYFRTNAIFSLISKWKWHLLIIIVAATVLGYAFSFFIHPKYKSSAVLYPANIVCHSDESESEQMLQILESDDIKFQIIKKYDLYSRYRIDTSKNGSLASMMSKYESNITIEKTENEAVMITVRDEDPQIAADMVNSIIETYDTLVLKMNAQKSMEILNIYSKVAKEKARAIDSLTEIMKKYGTEYGMIDMATQTRALSEAAANGHNQGNADVILKNWAEYKTDFMKTDTLLKVNVIRYINDLNICEDTRRDINKQMTYSHVISKPFVADKKYYPLRSVFALTSGIGGCLIGIIAIAIIEGCRKRKEEVDTQD